MGDTRIGPRAQTTPPLELQERQTTTRYKGELNLGVEGGPNFNLEYETKTIETHRRPPPGAGPAAPPEPDGRRGQSGVQVGGGWRVLDPSGNPEKLVGRTRGAFANRQEFTERCEEVFDAHGREGGKAFCESEGERLFPDED